jgi:hypothetical protein
MLSKGDIRYKNKTLQKSCKALRFSINLAVLKAKVPDAFCLVPGQPSVRSHPGRRSKSAWLTIKLTRVCIKINRWFPRICGALASGHPHD